MYDVVAITEEGKEYSTNFPTAFRNAAHTFRSMSHITNYVPNEFSS